MRSKAQLRHFQQPLIGFSRAEGAQSILAVAASADGRSVLTGGTNGWLRMWQLKSARCNQEWRGHQDAVTSIAVNRDGSLAVSGSVDGTARLWDTGSGQCRKVFTLPRPGVIVSVSLLHDSAQATPRSEDVLAVARTIEGDVVGWQIDAEKPVLLLTTRPSWLRRWCSVHPDLAAQKSGARAGARAPMSLCRAADRAVLVDAAQSKLHFCTLSSGRRLSTISLTERVHALCVDARFQHAVTAGADCCLRLWDLQEARCLRTFHGHQDEVSTVAWHYGSGLLASGSWDQTVKIWSLESEKCRQTYHEHTDWVQAVSFVANGSAVVSAGHDGRLHCRRLSRQSRSRNRIFVASPAARDYTDT